MASEEEEEMNMPARFCFFKKTFGCQSLRYCMSGNAIVNHWSFVLESCELDFDSDFPLISLQKEF